MIEKRPRVCGGSTSPSWVTIRLETSGDCGARRAAKIAELEAAAGLRFTTVDELARLAGERFMR